MTTHFTRLSAAVLLLAAYVTAQAREGDIVCYRRDVADCYWSFASQYGKVPLTEIPEDENEYLRTLCNSDPPGYPEDNICNRRYYGRCPADYIKEFASMERGYAALRQAITSEESCEAAALLGKCMDLGVVKECDVEVKAETFDEEVDRVLRTAENLRICVNEALKTCDPNQNASAISHLRKITDAVVDLFRLKDLPNTAHTAQAAKNVVTASLLCLLSHYMY